MKAAIICVDDEWTILTTLGQQLKRYFGKDYEIELANSGAEALSLCAELTAEGLEIPLVISDQRMQGMEGDTLLIQLHNLYPKMLKIMLTGQADADSVGNVVNAAALYRYIRKPWDETDLILTVAEALRSFEQEQQLAYQNTLLKEINAKLESSLSLLLATLEATIDGVLVLDFAGKVVSFNQKFAAIWNLPASTSTDDSQKLVDLILEPLIEADAIAFQALLIQENIKKRDLLRLKNGSVIEYYLQPQQLAGKIVGQVWSFRDVTQEKRTEETFKHQALHDPLTKLPNRALFDQKLSEALNYAAYHSEIMAMMFLDLDRFKEVNDTFGHSVGDLLLQGVIKRLVSCLREVDLIARWGGDEFAIVLPQIRSRKDAGEIAHRLVTALQPEFILEGHRIHATVSIGIAVYPDDGLDSGTLLRSADRALYHAKKSGRNNYSSLEQLTEKLG
ncbi:diguanylate cyclase domain-containing protein [Okeania sp. SIO1I7]|uniref:diguanylate cyclase domain-containing protein n=1 Tax=Okeania sp. SIO1I7 TaxID=2607772 RepID=UPI0013F6EB57|nr:diguanylate cyclase [Okeania sp. SIO1I7]NET27285.1 diguanylate cyclase [Okeania sp. SIO1I7]